jgi:hypothetical protein
MGPTGPGHRWWRATGFGRVAQPPCTPLVRPVMCDDAADLVSECRRVSVGPVELDRDLIAAWFGQPGEEHLRIDPVVGGAGEFESDASQSSSIDSFEDEPTGRSLGRLPPVVGCRSPYFLVVGGCVELDRAIHGGLDKPIPSDSVTDVLHDDVRGPAAVHAASASCQGDASSLRRRHQPVLGDEQVVGVHAQTSPCGCHLRVVDVNLDMEAIAGVGGGRHNSETEMIHPATVERAHPRRPAHRSRGDRSAHHSRPSRASHLGTGRAPRTPVTAMSRQPRGTPKMATWRSCAASRTPVRNRRAAETVDQDRGHAVDRTRLAPPVRWQPTTLGLANVQIRKVCAAS